MRFEVVDVEGSRIDRLAVTFEQRRRDRERDGDGASEPTSLEQRRDAE